MCLHVGILWPPFGLLHSKTALSALGVACVKDIPDLIGTDNFQILPYYSPISLLIAFASGLILTFITVVFSAYRASNLNIVVAIRGLKDEFVKKAPNPFRINLFEVLWNLIYPLKQLYFIISIN